jgi:hypothetical protein
LNRNPLVKFSKTRNALAADAAERPPALSGIVEIDLTDAQAELLAPLARRQATEHRGMLLHSVAPAGRGQRGWVMQVAYVPWEKVSKILRLLQPCE